jgi:hypothetical protein
VTNSTTDDVEINACIFCICDCASARIHIPDGVRTSGADVSRWSHIRHCYDWDLRNDDDEKQCMVTTQANDITDFRPPCHHPFYLALLPSDVLYTD